MAQSSRTFRIFVSSTFSDLKAERDALQKKVFPRLRDLATAHGCCFQAIDLRWGVSEEAALNQQTLKICLGEIERCQKTSPRPNFIVLLGDRYGWRPLPYEIPAAEFEQIINNLTDRGERLLVESWFRRDDNAIPPTYVLQPRTDEFIDAEKWALAEEKLHSILEREAGKITLSPEELRKYSASATEQEIFAGALKVPDASEHVFCFLRDIQGLPEDGSTAIFRETDPGAAQKQAELKEHLKKRLPGNIHEYTAKWREDAPSQDHLDHLCEDVYADLSRVILAEIGKLEKVDPLDAETVAHETFGKERAHVFIGRMNLLKAIGNYIEGDDPHPLVVWGASGSGKSALMAKAIEQAQKNVQGVLYRFIGATPASSNGRALLESLCKQISRRYGEDESTIPSEYKDLVKEFSKRLALAKPDKPLILFLDALDQLSDTDNGLVWLPEILPQNVHLLVSTLLGDSLKALENIVSAKNHLEVQPMSGEDGQAILETWFREIHRKLQENQEQYLLGKFRNSGLPLYLKLAFEEARLWKSYEAQPELSDNIPGILRDLFKRLSLESNHGQILVSHGLGYLAAAKNGLSEDELLDVLSMDKEMLADFQRRSPKSPKVERLPVVIWSRLYFDLEPYLTERSADDTSLLTFYHRQMSEASQAAYRNKARHAGLAEYFTSKPLHLDQKETVPNLRKLSEMVYQQAWAGLSTYVEKTLLDYNYLHTKLTGQGIQELIEDYALVHKAGVSEEKKKTLSLLQGALRLSAHVLGKDPLQLPGQLTGRLLWFKENGLHGLLDQMCKEVKHPWLRPLHACLDAPAGALLRTLAGHNNSVNSLAVTADGRRAISGSGDKTLKVWDLESGACIHTLEGHTNEVHAVALTPDGRRAVSGSDDQTLKVWDLESGICIRTLEEHKASIRAVAVTADGRQAISGSYDRTLKVWDLESGVCLRTLNDSNNVHAVSLTPDGRLAVSGSYFTLTVWDLKSGACIHTLEVRLHPAPKSIDIFNPPQVQWGEGWVSAVAVTADGRRAVIGSEEDSTLSVWDLESGTSLRTLEGHMLSVTSLALTPDGTKVISGSHDRTLKVWDLESGKCLRTLEGHSDRVWSVIVTEDGQRAVSGSSDNTLKVWDLENDTHIRIPEGHRQLVTSVVLTQDGQRAVSGSSDNTLKVWNLGSGACIRTLEGHRGSVDAIELTPDGRRAVSRSWDRTLKVWDLESGACIHTLDVQGSIVTAMAVTLDGRRAVSASWYNIKMWDLESGACIRRLEGHTDKVSAIALTPNGRRAVSGSWDHTLKVWDLESGKCIHTLEGHTDTVYVLALTPDGRRVVSGSGRGDGTLKVWDLESGTCVHTLKGHTSHVAAVALTPDGRRVISGSWDHTLKVWDVESGECMYTLEGHIDDIRALALALDGRRAVSTGGNINMWELESGCNVTSVEGDAPLLCITVAPDGLTYIAGDAGGRLYFLHLENVAPPAASVVIAWDSNVELAFGCPHCRTWSEIPKSALGSEIPCPNCGNPIKLNPFTIEGDWKPVAKAW